MAGDAAGVSAGDESAAGARNPRRAAFSAYGPAFSTDDQLYASAGYAVLYTNPRGSTSYGEEFANLIDKNYPAEDYDDLMSVGRRGDRARAWPIPTICS